MSQPVALNSHRGLAPDELSRRYRATRDALTAEEIDGFHDHDYDYDYDHNDYDDYWDPQRGQTADDYMVLKALEQSIGFAFKAPKIGALLPGSSSRLASSEPWPSPLREGQPSYPHRELGDALFDHVQLLLSRARRLEFTYSAEFQAELQRVNGGTRGVEQALHRFKDRPGPIVMSLLFAPFWVRTLASWTPPQGDDATITTSLIEHLFQIYPVPRPVQQPWLAEGLPSLKAVCWLVLLGQGGNLHHAARRFGWSVARRFLQHFSTAPAELTFLEACMWAEIARRGGDRVDFDRIRRDPAFALDPTEAAVTTPEPAMSRVYNFNPLSEREREELNEAARAFWRQTVEWMIPRRAQLTDESCAIILEWAMHLHTEGARVFPRPRPAFTWSGRELAGTRAAALEYRRTRDMPYGDLAWTTHGLDWDLREGETVTWTIRELLSSTSLGEESRTMHHCVASYSYRCAQGKTAIFSVCAAGDRKVTVELDPFSRRIMQVRGLCNRAATIEEQTVLSRWLAATSPAKLDAARAASRDR